MKRIILLTLAILIFTTQTAFAVNYPHTGYCTGNYVRLRDNPGTEDTEVLEGRLFDGNLVILLDEVFVDGDKWYEIDYPFGEGTAWIFGKYIENYEGEIDNIPEYRFILQVYQDFGTKPEKAKSIFGKPKKSSKRTFYWEPAGRNVEEETLEYPKLTLNYIDGRLQGVEITGKGSNLRFGKIRVGDDTSKLQEEFGEPAEKYDNSWEYEIAGGLIFEFYIRNGEIYKMSYGERMD